MGWSVVRAMAPTSSLLWAWFHSLSACLTNQTVRLLVTVSADRIWKDTRKLLLLPECCPFSDRSRRTASWSGRSFSDSFRDPSSSCWSRTSRRSRRGDLSAMLKPNGCAQYQDGDSLQPLAGHSATRPTTLPSCSAHARTYGLPCDFADTAWQVRSRRVSRYGTSEANSRKKRHSPCPLVFFSSLDGVLGPTPSQWNLCSRATSLSTGLRLSELASAFRSEPAGTPAGQSPLPMAPLPGSAHAAHKARARLCQRDAVGGEEALCA
mmetsp:Transcript_49406/g.127502  ORF Transcript_49406/g.127502 Transcript_49406/m.127502 type:complete len:265 (+) Transcript_49406:1045-1839(+)